MEDYIRTAREHEACARDFLAATPTQIGVHIGGLYLDRAGHMRRTFAPEPGFQPLQPANTTEREAA